MVARFTLVQLLKNFPSSNSSFSGLLKQILLFVFPIRWHRAILAEVVIVVKFLLVFDDLAEHLYDYLLDLGAHPVISEHLLEDLEGDLPGGQLSIEDMLLEEGILTVHVSAVEQSVAVHDFIPVVLLQVFRVVILFVLNVVLVTFYVFARNLTSCGKGQAGCAISLET